MRFVVPGLFLIATCRNVAVDSFVPVAGGPVGQQVEAVLSRDSAHFVALRRDLHRHPELSGEEDRTAGVVASAMRRLGLEVRTGVGGHGVVAILRGGRPGPTVAYRADMDAVPTSDPDPVEFRSVVAGVRHICGHDVHTAVGIAVATALRQVRDSLPGTVMFVFQPAEERATGANAMLADGVFSAVQPAAIYGLHTSAFETGIVATTPGPMMAGRDRFEVTVGGSGNVGEAADQVAARIVSLNTITSNQLMSSQPPDLIFAQVTGRSTSGSGVRLQGVATVATVASRARMRALIVDGLDDNAGTGIVVTSQYEERWIAGVTNDSLLSEAAADTARHVLGAGGVVRLATVPAAFSEDFGSFQARVPGVFFFLGVSNSARQWAGYPHRADYVADERSIQVGARVMSAVIVERLRRTDARSR